MGGREQVPMPSPRRDAPLCPAVNYDSCPRAIEASIWWPRTRFGLPAAAPCPKGSVGRWGGVGTQRVAPRWHH